MLTFQEYLSVWKRWYKCAAMEISQESFHLSTIIKALKYSTPVPENSHTALNYYLEKYNEQYTPFCPGTEGFKLTEGRWIV